MENLLSFEIMSDGFEFGYYMFKESFDDDVWKTVDLRSNRATILGEQASSISNICRKINGHIKQVKLLDIRKQMPYIPEIYKEFYTGLRAGDDEDVSSSVESEENEAPATRTTTQKASLCKSRKKMKNKKTLQVDQLQM